VGSEREEVVDERALLQEDGFDQRLHYPVEKGNDEGNYEVVPNRRTNLSQHYDFSGSTALWFEVR
jgi:hypothetical protein